MAGRQSQHSYSRVINGTPPVYKVLFKTRAPYPCPTSGVRCHHSAVRTNRRRFNPTGCFTHLHGLCGTFCKATLVRAGDRVRGGGAWNRSRERMYLDRKSVGVKHRTGVGVKQTIQTCVWPSASSHARNLCTHPRDKNVAGTVRRIDPPTLSFQNTSS
jgi:hypothetical protein